MERMAPAPKDQPVSLSLPKMHNAMDASEAAESALTAVSEGELTPIEATVLSDKRAQPSVFI
jgi:hypothetical protein